MDNELTSGRIIIRFPFFIGISICLISKLPGNYTIKKGLK